VKPGEILVLSLGIIALAFAFTGILILDARLSLVSVSASAVAVNFPDSGLEIAIREEIRKLTGDINDTDLIELTYLNAYNRGIVNLEGIEHCTDLTNLMLDSNQIVDISPLSALTKLERLCLHDNQIVDISVLSALANLTQLYLNKNEIVDISPLSGLTKLEELGLHDNQIVDISPLSGLTKLEMLWLNDNQIHDIAPIVDNPGIDDGDLVRLDGNQLLLKPGSPDMRDIETLVGRGVGGVLPGSSLFQSANTSSPSSGKISLCDLEGTYSTTRNGITLTLRIWDADDDTAYGSMYSTNFGSRRCVVAALGGNLLTLIFLDSSELRLRYTGTSSMTFVDSGVVLHRQ